MMRFAQGIAAGAFALGAVSAVFAAPASARPGYDGSWSVLIVTEKGNCDRAYRYALKINNGQIAYAGESAFNVSGRVQPNGAISVSVGRGEQQANGTGRLSDKDGSGRWTGGECSGTWQAERRS